MVNEETRRKLQELSLDEMIKALEIQSQINSYQTLSFDERFRLLIDYTYQEKYINKVKRLMKMARFRFPQASIDDVYFTERGLDRQQILGIASCQFVKTHTNLIFHGFTGSGKSFLACAIGRESCKQGYRTCYIRMPDLLQLHGEASVTPSGPAKLQVLNFLHLCFGQHSLSPLISYTSQVYGKAANMSRGLCRGLHCYRIK